MVETIDGRDGAHVEGEVSLDRRSCSQVQKKLTTSSQGRIFLSTLPVGLGLTQGSETTHSNSPSILEKADANDPESRLV